MTGDEMREVWTEALADRGIDDWMVDALLPVVRKIAADELRAAADWLWDDNGEAAAAYHHLTDRADALDPS